MFLIPAPPYDLFTLFASKSSEIKINQILFCKVNLGIFRSLAFNCHIETKLASQDAF